MNNTDFVLAYEQNPLIYDYIYKNGVFYKNNTGQRQYHFPEIDLSNNKLDIVNEKINDDSIVYFCMNEFESLLNILGKNFNKKHVLLADGGDGNVHNLDLTGCGVTDVSMLGNVHTLSLRGCKNVTDVSMLGNVHTLDVRFCSRISGVHMLKNTCLFK